MERGRDMKEGERDMGVSNLATTAFRIMTAAFVALFLALPAHAQDGATELLSAINTGAGRERGAVWYAVGRYVYVPLAVILCCVALFRHVAF